MLCEKTKLETSSFVLGPEPTLFGKPKFSCMRLHYRRKEASGYFHTLRAVMRSPEEDGKGKEEERGNYSEINLVTALHLFPVHCLGHWVEDLTSWDSDLGSV